MPLGKRPYSNEKSWEEIERCRNNLWYALDGLQKVDHDIPENVALCVDSLIIAHIENAFNDRLRTVELDVVRTRPR